MQIRSAGLPAQLNTLSSVAKAFSLPQTQPPMRLPSYPAIERTSLLSFNATKTLAVTSVAIANRGLLTRQAMFPLWCERDLSGGYSLMYRPPIPGIYDPSNPVNGYSRASADSPGAWTLDGAGIGDQSYPFYSSGNDRPNAVIVSASALEPGYPWLGLDGESTGTYFYVPAGWTTFLATNIMYAVPLDDTSNDTAIYFVVDEYTTPGEYVTRTLKSSGLEVTQADPDAVGRVEGWVTAAGATFAPTKNTWLRLRSVYLGDSGSSAIQGESVSGPVLVVVGPHIEPAWTYTRSGMPSEPPAFITNVYLTSVTVTQTRGALAPYATTTAYATSDVPFLNTRLTAVAALFTNVTKVLSKEGTVLAARFNPEQMDVFNIVADNYQDVHPSEKYFYGLEKGFYTYAAPSTDLGFFYDYTVRVGSITSKQTLPVYRLDNAAMVNSWTFTDPDGGSSLAVNLDWHVEFRNSSQLWPIGMSSMTLETLHTAQLVLATVGCFFDNVDHRYILGQVAKAAKWLMPVVSTHPATKALAEAAIWADERWGKKAKAVQNPPKPKPKPQVQPPGKPAARADIVPRDPPGQPKTTSLPVEKVRPGRIRV